MDVIGDLNHETSGFARHSCQNPKIFGLERATIVAAEIMLHIHFEARRRFALSGDFARSVLHTARQSGRNNDGIAFTFCEEIRDCDATDR